MDNQHSSPHIVTKLEWLARILCLVYGFTILIWFGIVLHGSGHFASGQIIVLTAYPIIALIAWHWSLTGGVIAALLSSFFIYVTFIDICLYVRNDYTESILPSSIIGTWLVLSFLFVIGALMHITAGMWKQKNRGASVYRIVSSFIKVHKWRLIIWLTAFLIIAAFSFTSGNTIVDFSQKLQRWPHPPKMRIFNHFLWLPYSGYEYGILPWDEGGYGPLPFQLTIWGSHLMFFLSVLWWALLSAVGVVLGSIVYGRYVRRHR